MNLWLTDIKTNPNYSLKNRELIERILQRQYMILNHRSEMQHNFFVSAKKELDGHIESGGIEVLYKEEYERQVKRNINMDQKLVELKTAMTSQPPNLSTDDLIFDERKGQGIDDIKEKTFQQSLKKLNIDCK